MNSTANKRKSFGFPFAAKAKRKQNKNVRKNPPDGKVPHKQGQQGYTVSDFSLFRDPPIGKQAQDEAFQRQSSEYGRKKSPKANTRKRENVSAKQASAPRTGRSASGKQRRARRISAFFLVVVLLLGGVVVSCNLLLKIEGFRMEGESIYTQEELEQVFGVKAGASMFGFNTQKLEQEMETSLPYLETVKIRRRLPGIVLFEVTPATETYYAVQAEQYVIFSPTLKTLRMSEEAPDGLIEIVGFENASAILGLCVEPADETQGMILNTIIAQTKSLPKGSISRMEVQDAASICFVWEGRIQVKMGSRANLAEKIDYALLVLQDSSQNRMTGSERGTLDVSQYPESPQVVFTPDLR